MKKILFVLIFSVLSFSASAQVQRLGDYPTAKNPLPVSRGGTGNSSSNAMGAIVGAKSFQAGPVWPSIYPNPPTVTYASATTGITTPQSSGLNGMSLGLFASGSNLSGQNTINIGTTNAPKINVGDLVSITYFTATSPTAFTGIPAVPPGTVVTSVNTGTGAVTLSNNLLYTIANQYPVFIGPSVFNYIGNNQVYGSFYNGVWAINGSSGSISESSWVIETDYTSGTTNGELDLYWRLENGTSAQIWVWVDGQPITSDAITTTGLTAGTSYYTKIVFNNVGDNASRTRRIRIYGNQTDPYCSSGNGCALMIGPTDSLSSPKIVYPKIVTHGDSYIEGASSTSSQFQNIAYKVAYLLGGGAPYLSGQGGTGIISNGGGGGKATFCDSTRLATLSAYAADINITFGSINDGSGNGSATVSQSVASSCYSAIHQANPTAKMFVIGVQSTGNTSDVGTIRISNDINQQAASLGLNLPYLSPIQEHWVWGTGKQGSTTGLGNADVFLYSDGVHPSTLGADFYARKIAQFVANNY